MTRAEAFSIASTVLAFAIILFGVRILSVHAHAKTIRELERRVAFSEGKMRLLERMYGSPASWGLSVQTEYQKLATADRMARAEYSALTGLTPLTSGMPYPVRSAEPPLLTKF